MTSRGMPRLAGLMAVAVFALLMTGCSESTGGDPDPDPYLARTSPDNVLNNFQVAWRTRNIGRYSQLLAEDYRFYFDNETRTHMGLPPYWTTAEESTQVGNLFNSQQVAGIYIALKWPLGTAHPATEPGRENWVYLDVLDVLLEVDLTPTTDLPEGVTLQVDDQKQRYYFRRGKTEPAAPGDTLFYLTEWRDYGSGSGYLSNSGVSRPTTSESSTWGGIKAIFR